MARGRRHTEQQRQIASRRFSAEEIAAAVELTGPTVTRAASHLGLDAPEIQRLVLLEFDEHVKEAIGSGTEPKTVTREHLAELFNYALSTVNTKFNELSPGLAQVALLLMLRLLDYGRSPSIECVIERLYSNKKLVYGPTFCVEDVHVPGLLVRPRRELDAAGLAEQIIEEMFLPMVKVAGIEAAARASAAARAPQRGAPPSDLAPSFEVLVPLQAVGDVAGEGLYEALSPDIGAFEEWFLSSKNRIGAADGFSPIKSVIVEIEDKPSDRGLRWLNYWDLKADLGLAGRNAPLFSRRSRMGLDTNYAFEFDENRLVKVHRYVFRSTDKRGEAARADSFATIGFGRTKVERLQALERIERLVARGRVWECVQCFNGTVAPLNTSVWGESGISFLCSCRVIAYLALMHASRPRH